jgi:PPM family protein phosphatase
VRIGRAIGVTDTGKRRMRNEDAFVCASPLFAVADGMGGAQAGELASGVAAAALAELERGTHGEQAVAELIQEANVRVYRRAIEDPDAAGMGTTVTVALVDEQEETVAIGHVGDSRAYLIRDGKLTQLTTDHSLVGELERSGRLTAEEARVHPQRSVITRALGTEEDVDVDTHLVEAEPGDLFLICSDGLPSMVRDEEISELVEAAGRDPERIARSLVEAANRAGGDDNVTVVAFELVEGHAGTLDPDERTAENAPIPAPPAAPVPGDDVARHGAGHGSRMLALAAIVLVLAAAALVVWWGVAR